MSKKTMITACAMVLSLVFCIGYFVVFAQLNKGNTDTPVVQNPETTPTVKPETKAKLSLNWIQLGVFAKEASVEELSIQLTKEGFEFTRYQKNDLYVLAAGISEDAKETAALKQKLEAKGFEVMDKKAELTDKALIEAFNAGNLAQVMEGISS